MTTKERLTPILLTAGFTTVLSGWFTLPDLMPRPLALLTGLVIGLVIGVLGTWLRSRPALGPRLEDTFVALGVTGFAFAACGGLMALLLLNGAMESPSLTGETLESTFLPSIPFYIVANSVLEMAVLPSLITLSWRPGRRRVLILASIAAFFAMRVWTYLTFVPNRLGWAESSHSHEALTAAERAQAHDDLLLDDPRWWMLLVLFAVLLFAMRLAAPVRRTADTPMP